MEKECLAWYSQYNKTADGYDLLREEGSNEAIPMGAGILEQIPNIVYYSKLTYNKIKDIVLGVYSGNASSHGMSVTLMTGLGGMDEFDKAMKGYIKQDISSNGYLSNETSEKTNLYKTNSDINSSTMGLRGHFNEVEFIEHLSTYRMNIIKHNYVFITC